MSFPSTGLLERLKAYCFPAGENAVRGVLGIKTTQRGEIRSDLSLPIAWAVCLFISAETLVL